MAPRPRLGARFPGPSAQRGAGKGAQVKERRRGRWPERCGEETLAQRQSLLWGCGPESGILRQPQVEKAHDGPTVVLPTREGDSSPFVRGL